MPENIERIVASTPDLAHERLAQLRQLFPEVWSEDGLDFDKLRQALGDLTDERPERYLFSWAGKRDALRLLQAPSHATLRPAVEESLDWDSTQHLYIEGDNLEALKLLYKPLFGRVKMIYIDPPYNTGNDFVYPDNFADPLRNYLVQTGQKDANGDLQTSNPENGGRIHSRWLSMMYPRLFLARQLLRDDGVIFVSIDDNEVHHLRLLMNEVFGEENFLSSFYIQVRYPDKTLVEDADFHKMIETVLVYGRSAESKLNKVGSEYSLDKFVWQIIEKASPSAIIELGGKQVEVFAEGNYDISKSPPSFGNLKEVWATGKVLDGNSSGRFFRDYLTARQQTDGLGTLYKVHGIGDDQFSYRYFTGPKRAEATKGKYYQGVPSALVDNLETGRRELPIANFFNLADSFGNCRHEGGVEFRSGKKPVALLNKLLNLGSNEGSDDIILDFFSGSGTTAQAVLELNREDGGNRRFVLVQLPEPTGNGQLPTIAEIGKERIRRVVARMKEAQNGKLEMDTRATPEDLGFKVWKLGESHFRQMQPTPPGDTAAYLQQLEMMNDALLPDADPQSVLYEVALREGFGLNARVAAHPEVAGVWQVSDVERDQSFFISIESTVELDALRPLNLSADHLFICRGSALDDTTAANLALQCRLKMI